ncbi:MAG: response regulator [Deltaproteobacteria bacterium]|nr:response regulator [Deltaproteobacteria bacterium]
MLLKKLVIAEDDDAVAHLVAASLGDAGFLCLRARDGEQAMNLVRSELPDALVLDVMMPKMDGIQVAQRVKGDVLLSRVPILMLTSLAGVENRVEGLEAGADDYLSKPFDLRELAARVKALIRQSRRERDRNPTTNLPGSQAIEDEVENLLVAKERFTLLYIDIENFRTYADVYGYRKADEVVAHTGRLILQRCRAIADPPPFVGHLGGDDFMVICRGTQVETLREEIDEALRASIPQLYTEEDIERGYITLSDESGELRRAQIMSASVATLVVEADEYKSTEDLAKVVTRVKHESGKHTGSGLFSLKPSES